MEAEPKNCDLALECGGQRGILKILDYSKILINLYTYIMNHFVVCHVIQSDVTGAGIIVFLPCLVVSASCQQETVAWVPVNLLSM